MYIIELVYTQCTYEYTNITIPLYQIVEKVGIDPGAFDSSSQYSIHWTSLTKDAELMILVVSLHTVFLLKENISDVIGIEP